MANICENINFCVFMCIYFDHGNNQTRDKAKLLLKFVIITKTLYNNRNKKGGHMLVSVRKKILFAIGFAALPISIVHTVFLGARFMPSKASQYQTVLNANNAPVLTNGEGTMVDDKNVTWEYHNASDLVNGHVSLGHQGYFGVSSSTDWGYATISAITVNFTSGENGELWLLTSLDGTAWSEAEKLTSGTATINANNWNFVRFYGYDASNALINVSSVTIDYECNGSDPDEDTDLAKIENVRQHDATNLSVETQNVSPRGHSTEALRLTSTNGRSTNNHVTIFNIPATTLGKIKHMKVEFDYYYAEKRDPKKAPGYPTSAMANADGAFGNEKTIAGAKGFTYEDIGGGWWHMECYVNAYLQLSEYALSASVTGIVIKDNAIYTHDTSAGEKVGFIIIDNLRMTCYENSAIIVNAWDTVEIGGTGDHKYFIRECVGGTINSVSYAISDETYGTLYMGQKNNNGNNLCYINPIAQGDVVVTITYNLGYLHETVVIHTVTLHVK